MKYRKMKNQGVVAVFKRDRFDRYSNFARIGDGKKNVLQLLQIPDAGNLLPGIRIAENKITKTKIIGDDCEVS